MGDAHSIFGGVGGGGGDDDNTTTQYTALSFVLHDTDFISC